MKTIFDIGMYDGTDTAYYLESGYNVVAVEANPELVRNAERRFPSEIAAGRLVCVHAAVSEGGRDVELFLSRSDPGSSSVFSERVLHKQPAGRVVVQGTTLRSLFDRFGVPYYVKVDIEGADRHCVLDLTSEKHPDYVSFEIGNDAMELMEHLVATGYSRFKIISQSSFRELANVRCFYDRAAHLVMRVVGFRDHRMIRRGGRYFVKGHSSGPVPWRSDGRWSSCEEARKRLAGALPSKGLTGWYDLHASTGSHT